MRLIKASAHSLPLAAESVNCIVTSPPYWGSVRVYAGEQAINGWGCALGEERQPELYVSHLIEVFAEMRRVLRADGCAWLNVGDVFAASGKGGGGSRMSRGWSAVVSGRKGFRMPPEGYKQKDLTLVAFQLADALRRDGWYLRQTVIWEKPSAIEPKRLDRPSSSHEYVFLLAKSKRYEARDPGEPWWGQSVWRIQPDANSKHPATMPLELARRCILGGSKPGDVVLDPFNGSGTTGVAAIANGRSYIGVDISDEYLADARERIAEAQRHLPEQVA